MQIKSELENKQVFEDNDHEYSTLKELTNLYAAGMFCGISEEYFAMTCVAGNSIEKVNISNVPKECMTVLDIPKDYINKHHNYEDYWIKCLRDLTPDLFEKYLSLIHI